MTLEVEVHRALSWHGEISFTDPDGIVEDARFVTFDAVQGLMASAPLWVREPLEHWLLSWLAGGEGRGSASSRIRGLEARDVSSCKGKVVGGASRSPTE
ncbi:MAG: hypothetical protein CM1200mP26_24670 [Acidimicrobiales bacterium]|nr:MAG: hypothetical protein CM1200mP26_24670 [Acidimicrobiales bacterium]